MIKTKKYRVSSKRKELYRLTYTIYDFYQNYPDKNKIPKDKYIGVLKDFYKLLTKKVIIDRKKVELPYNLSNHRIKKIKQSMASTPKIDFNKSKLLGVKVYHLNNHSSGFYFRWYWDRYPFLTKNKKMYKFELTKTNALLLAKEIFRCNGDPYIKDYDALR
jgi:hypothetical protein